MILYTNNVSAVLCGTADNSIIDRYQEGALHWYLSIQSSPAALSCDPCPIRVHGYSPTVVLGCRCWVVSGNLFLVLLLLKQGG
jgi:hypothetical protein